MHTAAILVAVFTAIFCSLLPLMLILSRRWQERARERRMAEHRMNARLLRLDI